MTRKIVIVGGVGGGATVAAQLRRQDKDSEIIIFDKGSHIAFSNCGMPYYIGGVVSERDHLLRETDKFAKKYNVTVRTQSEVTAINRSQKQVQYNHEHVESYDKLILAPGASAIVPDIEGLNTDRAFPLHTIPDMDSIYAYIEANKPKSVAVVGAGFVGLEMVENFKEIGLDCTIIDRSSQVMKLVDPDLGSVIQEHIEKKGVEVILDDGLASFTDDGQTLQLNSGKSVQADMTLLAVGVKPNTALAKDALLNLGDTGAISVNEFMQTNDPDIYALGDVVETNHYLTNTPSHIALAWPAHRQAFIIASHLDGEQVPYRGTLGSAILKVFDLDVGVTGHSSTTLNELGINFKEASLEARSHAGYYPGSEKIHIKILFDPHNGKIYGAQVVGGHGVDKRIAVLVTAIQGKLTVKDLPELELPYAPPYSSPKDPINILGYKASAMLETE
ncbi:CoA-disulfide reductase [Virgibacillus byunsanensis]|uniref:CoA-disulfide reductase n=1 Tax=Virgibacillus byunsanensis TaxID=570945 RepID=A0ABW3LSI7_9BACI